MKSIATFGVTGMAVLALACDGARGTNENTAGTAGDNSAEVEWVEESMAAGNFEVELGKIAQQKATSPEVKQFAEMMVRDHTKAGEELKQVAQQHALQATPEMENEHRDLMEDLQAKNGADFDRAYMEAMVDSHQNVVDHLQTRADDTRDATGTTGNQDDAHEQALSQWAAKTLPTARHHLDEARRIEDALGDR